MQGSLNWVLSWLPRFPPLLKVANWIAVCFYASRTPPRPHAFTLWSASDAQAPAPRKFVATQWTGSLRPKPAWVSNYTSWPGLFDRGFTGRHLPPRDVDDKRPVPPAEAIADLFARKGEMRDSVRSSALFCFFAQWFTDSFLRTHPTDPRRTTSNHEIDLCQIYGLDEPSTRVLRSGQDGLLKARVVDGFEFPVFLYKDGQLDPQFFDPKDEIGLTYLRAGRARQWEEAIDKTFPGATTDPERRDWFYASGLDRGGSTVVYSAFNTLFLREHNRIARALGKVYDWDDDRLFETARLINIRQVLNVVVGDYITHIAGVFPFGLDRTFAEGERWYRVNRISIEFDLLYRWHSLVPDFFRLAGQERPHTDYRFNNHLFESLGLEQVISDASRQVAGRIGLGNTPHFLHHAELRGLHWARDFRVEGFNAYRKRFDLPAYTSMLDLTGDEAVAQKLNELYDGQVDAVELTVGLFAEKRDEGNLMAETLLRMVAYDAFTHILTNPVLASEVHNVATFSAVGWKIINENAGLAEIIKRNADPSKDLLVSLSVVRPGA